MQHLDGSADTGGPAVFPPSRVSRSTSTGPCASTTSIPAGRSPARLCRSTASSTTARGPAAARGFVDSTNLGKYLFEVHDKADDRLLFSRGFASVYGEWETTPRSARRRTGRSTNRCAFRGRAARAGRR